MELTLYYCPLSAPSRAILTFLNLTGLRYQKKAINTFKGEQKSPEYLSINPFGNIPAIQDDSYPLFFESETIIKYLIGSRKVGHEFYPNDPEIRSEVDNYMLFHHNNLEGKVSQYFMATYPTIMHSKIGKEQTRVALEEVLKTFQEGFLQGKKYIAGEKPTLADLFAANELATIYLGSDYDFNKFPVIRQYIERCLINPVVSKVNQPLRDFAEKMRQPAKEDGEMKKKKKIVDQLTHKKHNLISILSKLVIHWGI